MTISRRNFLKICMSSGVIAALHSIPGMAKALEKATQNMDLLWLQGQSCSGCSVSFLNSESPDVIEILTQYISLKAHSTLSTATGDLFIDIVNKTIDTKEYILAVEGSIPFDMPEACILGDQFFSDILLKAIKGAQAVVAVGTCATFGGIPGAEGNLTGAIGVQDFLLKNNLTKPLINVPGCPIHPDWLVGTIFHVLNWGVPPLDDKKRPKAFFSKLLHDQCPRFSDYEREKFAQNFGDDGCLFKLGCLGINTFADCTKRDWNGINSCIKAGAPCVGCADVDFMRYKNFPVYRKGGKDED